MHLHASYRIGMSVPIPDGGKIKKSVMEHSVSTFSSEIMFPNHFESLGIFFIFVGSILFSFLIKILSKNSTDVRPK